MQREEHSKMDISNLGSRRKIVHVWDVFAEKGGKEKSKSKPVTTTNTGLFKEKSSGIYLADGVSHGVKIHGSPGRKKRLAPKPPLHPHNLDASHNSVNGLKEISNLDETPFSNSNRNNLINSNIPEYDPVTGLRMSNSDESENVSSHGFIFGKESGKMSDSKYLGDLNSPTESMDDPFGLTASNASKISTRASSGYYSDGDMKESIRKHVSKDVPSYPGIKESDAESEINNNHKDNSDEDSFEEDEMTMSFDEEEEDVEGREKKLYEEYAGDDFSVFIQEEANEKKKKRKIKKKTKSQNKTDILFEKNGTADHSGGVYKGTLLGITRNFGNKSTLSSFDKLSNFSFADSKIGSTKPDSKSQEKDTKEHWWDISSPRKTNNEKQVLHKNDGSKVWNSAVIPETDFSVFSYDQR